MVCREMEPFRGRVCYWEELSLQTFPWKRYGRSPLPVSVFLTVRILLTSWCCDVSVTTVASAQDQVATARRLWNHGPEETLLSGVFQPWYYSNGKLMSTVWRMGRVVSVVAHSCNSRTRDAKAGGLLWAQTGLGEVVNSRIAWVTDWEPVSTCPFRNPHSKKQIPLKTKKHPKAF